jgi:hypothetical protein
LAAFFILPLVEGLNWENAEGQFLLGLMGLEIFSTLRLMISMGPISAFSWACY